jgi:hypothetical protein
MYMSWVELMIEFVVHSKEFNLQVMGWKDFALKNVSGGGVGGW